MKQDHFHPVDKEFHHRRNGIATRVAPTASGGWSWWVQTPQRRFAGESPTSGSARSTVSLVLWKLDHGEDPTFHLGQWRTLPGA